MAKKSGGSQNSGPRPKKKRKSGGLKIVLISALATVIAGLVLLTFFSDRLPSPYRPHYKPAKPSPLPDARKPEAELKDVRVFFSDEEGLHLKGESRRIKTGSLEAEVSAVLSELLRGPKLKTFERAVPAGTKLIGVKIKDGTAFVDLSMEIIERHGGGSSGEIQTVYAIVDTVVVNFPEIKKVQLLVEGKTRETIAGHIDISVPLTADRRIIKG